MDYLPIYLVRTARWHTHWGCSRTRYTRVEYRASTGRTIRARRRKVTC